MRHARVTPAPHFAPRAAPPRFLLIFFLNALDLTLSVGVCGPTVWSCETQTPQFPAYCRCVGDEGYTPLCSRLLITRTRLPPRQLTAHCQPTVNYARVGSGEVNRRLIPRIKLQANCDAVDLACRVLCVRLISRRCVSVTGRPRHAPPMHRCMQIPSVPSCFPFPIPATWHSFPFLAFSSPLGMNLPVLDRRLVSE